MNYIDYKVALVRLEHAINQYLVNSSHKLWTARLHDRLTHFIISDTELFGVPTTEFQVRIAKFYSEQALTNILKSGEVREGAEFQQLREAITYVITAINFLDGGSSE